MRRSIYVAVIITLPFAAWSDEGMWTIDNFPSSRVSEKYNVDVDEEWLRSAQLSTTRLENGCTGSFASADGLVLTNNHCTWGCIQDLSSDERNLSDEGFIANSRQEELQCPGQQISVLVELDNVTKDIASTTREIGRAHV